MVAALLVRSREATLATSVPGQSPCQHPNPDGTLLASPPQRPAGSGYGHTWRCASSVPPAACAMCSLRGALQPLLGVWSCRCGLAWASSAVTSPSPTPASERLLRGFLLPKHKEPSTTDVAVQGCGLEGQRAARSPQATLSFWKQPRSPGLGCTALEGRGALRCSVPGSSGSLEIRGQQFCSRQALHPVWTLVDLEAEWRGDALCSAFLATGPCH